MTKKEKIRMVLKLMKEFEIEVQDLSDENCSNDKKASSDVQSGQSNIERRVKKVLRWIGGDANLRGYMYLVTAIRKVVENENYIHNMIKWLYPEVAKEHNTTPSRAERAMRHFIKVCWDEKNILNLKKVFGTKMINPKNKPTNSKFIATVAEYIRINDMVE